MNQFKFTVVVPTRERSDTLFWTLKTCTMQEYEPLEIVVSDNFSGDNTRQVVESLRDSRVRYVNPGRRLSMSANWEFGLSHATGDYITILGDDDALLPGSISAINGILQCAPGMAALTWNASYYRWPNYIFSEEANKLSANSRRGITKQHARSNLQKALFLGQDHKLLPWLYAGFVSRSAISRVRDASGGQFFRSQIPDIYSAVALSCSIDEYLLAKGPYSIAGTSKSSNGISYFHSYKDASAANKFFQEDNIPFHRDLEMFPSLHLFVLESALQAHDAGLLPTDLLPPLVPTLRRAVMEVNPLHRAACEDAVAKILDKHQLKIRLGIPQGSAHGGLNIPRKIYNVVRENAFVEYAGSNHEFSNVYEAALRHDQLLLKRSSYLLRLLRNLGRKSISYLTRLGKSQANT